MKNDENWSRLPYGILRDSNINDAEIIVYSIILDYKPHDTNEVPITTTEIMLLTGKSESAVKRAIKNLKKAGYITNVRIEQGNKAYYTIVPVLPEKKRSQPPQSERIQQQDKPHSLETDITHEQYKALSQLLSTKLNDSTPERVDKLLIAFYSQMKAEHPKGVKYPYRYLKTMIENRESEKKPEMQDNSFDDDKYKICVNNF